MRCAKLPRLDTLLASSLPVLRECADEAFRAVCLPAGLASRWDVLAFIVVMGLIAFLGETARGLFAPLTQLEVAPLSLDPCICPNTRREPLFACWRRCFARCFSR